MSSYSFCCVGRNKFSLSGKEKKNKDFRSLVVILNIKTKLQLECVTKYSSDEKS